MSRFVHLHVHSEYSLLDGLGRIPQLIGRARELGMESLALTDHGALYGAIEFYREAQEQGIKPIPGCEVYVARKSMAERIPSKEAQSYHLTVLAKDRQGYHNLMQLCTKAHLEGYYYKPRIDKPLLEQHRQGLIVLSGCHSAEIPTLLRQGQVEQARRVALGYHEMLGPDNFYLELQDHDDPEMTAANRALVDMSRNLGIPLVATNDVHYVLSTDVAAHEVLLCIQTNTTIENPKRMRYGPTFYLKSPEEMAALFAEVPQALTNTLAIAEQCNLKLEFDRLLLPDFEVRAGETAGSYLSKLCWEGLRQRYQPVTPQAEERLRYELSVIEHTGFASYILIVWDIVSFAQQRDILFGIRGSAAGSIVCYCLGITDLDPLAWNLAFERFLNVERTKMPDIDMDFADDRRAEMIDYVTTKYGRDHVAQIITFGTLGARAAIRDVGRALGYPLNIADRVAKLVPTIPVGISIERAMKESAELRAMYENEEPIRKLIDTAKSLEGIARHASTHAAGVVISREPLNQHVPLQPVKGGEEAVMTQYPMGDLEHIGLLKMDFLGLANLTVLDRARDIVRESRGIDIDLQHIPLNDAKTFQMLSEGETTSIFQLEGAGMRRYIRELKPTSVADIAAMVALYRPGPMASIPRYIQAKHGEVSITYLHPRLKPILEPTYGVLVYQDQVLFIARDIADYSMGQADILRHAMGKKKPEEMRREKSNFLAGAQRNGISEAIANQIWDLMEPFAGYGFNAAHAACYATVAYQTAYLKANYPVEYMCAVLESALGNTDKIATAIGECRRLGIAILPPDINKSGARFTIESNAVRFGLAAIKNIGTGPVQDILDAREHGPFHSIEDFCQRVGPQAASKRVLESLIKAGALNSLARRSQLLSVLDRLTALAASAQRASVAGQKSMFDLAPTAAASLLVLPNLPEAPHKQRLAWEKELLGTYVSDHPLQRIAQGMSGMGIVFSNQLTSDTAGQRVTLAGMITRVRTITTKKGDPMAFVQLEDLQGEIEVVVFPSAYASTQDLWQDNTIVLVKGKVEVRDEKSKLICDSAKPYPSPELRPRTEPAEVTSPSTGPLPPSPPSTTGEGWGEGYHLHITVSRSGDQEQDIRRIGEVYRMLEDFPGQDRFSLYIPQGKGLVQLEFPNSTTSFTPALQERLLAILGPGSVRVERWSGTGDK